MDPDGSGKQRLTTGIDARDPAWNPAGNRLVYTRGVDDLLTLRAADGQGRRRLTRGPALDFEPAWAPGGRRIAFTRAFAAGDAGDMYVLDRATGDVTQVTDSPGVRPPGRLGSGRPPAGLRARLRAPVGNPRHRCRRLECAAADGGTARRHGSGVLPQRAPRRVRQRPPGRWAGDLWVMRADGSQQHRLRRQPFAEGIPDWQPVDP